MTFLYARLVALQSNREIALIAWPKTETKRGCISPSALGFAFLRFHSGPARPGRSFIGKL